MQIEKEKSHFYVKPTKVDSIHTPIGHERIQRSRKLWRQVFKLQQDHNHIGLTQKSNALLKESNLLAARIIEHKKETALPK